MRLPSFLLFLRRGTAPGVRLRPGCYWIVSSAQLLSNGNVTANSGFLQSDDYPFLPPGESASLNPEFSAPGQLSHLFATTGRIFKTWRMPDLYTPHR